MSLPDPSWAQKLPPGPHRHPLSAAPSHCSAGPVPPCPLLPAFHKRKAARHSLSGDWITFLHMEISFPRIRSPVPARCLASVVVNLPLGIFGAAECHGRWWIEGGAGSSHQPLGKSSKPMARSPRTVLPGTSGGVLGAHLSSSPHLSQLSWELRAPGAGGWDGCSPALLQLQIGHPSSLAGTPRGMGIFKGWQRRGGLTVPNIPSGDTVREEDCAGRWQGGTLIEMPGGVEGELEGCVWWAVRLILGGS